MERASKVRELLQGCLFGDGEDTSTAVMGDGIVTQFGFDPKKIEKNRDLIREVLTGLPKEFYSDTGGGWSFLNLCMDAKGEHWAEHRTLGELCALGQAAGYVSYPMPRDMWSVLPGGMPYIVIDAKARL